MILSETQITKTFLLLEKAHGTLIVDFTAQEVAHVILINLDRLVYFMQVRVLMIGLKTFTLRLLFCRL